MHWRDLAIGPAPQLGLDVYKRRRARLAKDLGPKKAIVVATHPVSKYSNDVDYAFRPHSDFWYLTGFNEPGCVLVLLGGSGETVLFLRGRRPAAEIWTGRRLGVERAHVLGIDQAFDVEELGTRLSSLLRGRRKVEAIHTHEPHAARIIRKAAGGRLVDGRPRLAEMRVIKDQDELKMIRKACRLGVAAHLEAASTITPSGHERHPEARFAFHARHEGSQGVGYASICGCGENAAVLHYTANHSPLRRGRPVLLDMGCEWGYYTSDITRTYPVGAFTPLQAKLYDLVHDAHQAALRQVKPGNRFHDPHDAAVAVLSAGMVRLGLLKGSPADVAKTSLRNHFMHGTSHFLGLDVHDSGWTRDEKGRSRILEPGMVVTVEPGLYFNPDFAPCPPGTRGIGIRIEDDVLVTAAGHRNLTARLPSQREAVEQMVGPR